MSFVGAVPALYEAHMVPMIFAPYAADLVARLRERPRPPKRILELSCGTGVLTRALAAGFPAADILATDLNGAMLDEAAARERALAATAGARTRPVVFRQADAMRLPFADANPAAADDDTAFDAVVWQFGAMFLPDKVKGFAEALRVLRPGGVLAFNTWDRIEDNELADVVTRALAEHFPGDPPRFLARTPHGYHDVDAVTADVVAAGFAKPSVQAFTVPFVSKAPSAEAVALAFCQGTPLRAEIELRGSLEEATRAVAAAVAARYGGRAPEGKMQAHVIVAERPL